MAAGKPHEPDEKSRNMARSLSGLGVPQEHICQLLGITKPTLHAHYRDDLDLGMAEANAKIASTLFSQATSGNTAALIFWAKARMGWRETQVVQADGTITLESIRRVIVDAKQNAGNPDS